MKAEIIHIEKYFDNITCTYQYQITINIVDKPNLKLGECEVEQ